MGGNVSVQLPSVASVRIVELADIEDRENFAKCSSRCARFNASVKCVYEQFAVRQNEDYVEFTRFGVRSAEPRDVINRFESVVDAIEALKTMLSRKSSILMLKVNAEHYSFGHPREELDRLLRSLGYQLNVRQVQVTSFTLPLCLPTVLKHLCPRTLKSCSVDNTYSWTSPEVYKTEAWKQLEELSICGNIISFEHCWHIPILTLDEFGGYLEKEEVQNITRHFLEDDQLKVWKYQGFPMYEDKIEELFGYIRPANRDGENYKNFEKWLVDHFAHGDFSLGSRGGF
ncbi:unnamed protein product [Caenorhabditis sp. 36 PRJEB53466]|nr:unnamed protein product [Caenorhabditis sp. 36 PRJEB53466]